MVTADWQDQGRTATLNRVGPSVTSTPVQRCWTLSPPWGPPPSRPYGGPLNEGPNIQTLCGRLSDGLKDLVNSDN